VFRLIPRWLHRAALPLAFALRQRWRRWRRRPIEGTSVIVTNRAGEVLLLRHSYGPDVWALPGGGLARGEQPEDCARRELAEEVAIEASALLFVGRIEEEISGAPHSAHLFACATNQTPVPDRREVVEARFFALDSLPRNLGRAARRRIEFWRRRAQRG